MAFVMERTMERDVHDLDHGDVERILAAPIPPGFPVHFNLQTCEAVSGFSAESWLQLVRAGVVPGVQFGRENSSITIFPPGFNTRNISPSPFSRF